MQATTKVYDLFGFLAPFLIKAKILFQKMWQKELKWDELLPEDLNLEWTNWYWGF